MKHSFLFTKIVLVFALFALVVFFVSNGKSESFEKTAAAFDNLFSAPAYADAKTEPVGGLASFTATEDPAHEQLRRSQEAQTEIVSASSIFHTAEEERLLDDLQQAKRDGDMGTVQRLEKALADVREPRISPIPESTPSSSCPDPTVTYLGADAEEVDGVRDGDKWLPHEYLLIGTDVAEYAPVICCRENGQLWAVVAREEADGFMYRVLRSNDGGEHWKIIWGLATIAADPPSMVMTKGPHQSVFIAAVTEDYSRVVSFRFDPDHPYSDYDLTTVYDYMVNGVNRPRLATDTDEYGVWYVYVVMNVMAPDGWLVMCARTVDYGETWDTPTRVGDYCVHQWDIDAYPDVDFGHGHLMVTYDVRVSSANPQRNIFVASSDTWGVTWGSPVALSFMSDDEYNPAISVAKNTTEGPYAVVAYTRYWNESDHDVWYAYSADGATWTVNRCLACTTNEEQNVNLAVSQTEGRFHAAYWDTANIDYATTDFDGMALWTKIAALSTHDTHSDQDVRPGISVDSTKPVDQEVAVAWTDTRNLATSSTDVYFDAGFLPGQPTDYFLYTTFDPGVGAVCGIDGFVDEDGVVEGIPGAEYIVFTGGAIYEGDITGYIYRVETAGDPNSHPDNPDNTGAIASRTFTQVSSHPMGYYACAHDNAFYVDETGIYYGASNHPHNDAPGWAGLMGCAVVHWDFVWNLLPCAVPDPAPGGAQTLAHNSFTGQWWSGAASRAMYRWDGTAWTHQFTAPDLGGLHHDGLTIINNALYVSDMTTDAIQLYRMDYHGHVVDPVGSPIKTYYYSAAPSVEGMGFGPNGHIWISGGVICEIGGGPLQVALTGIPNQCILPGEEFTSFDLDDYTIGTPPFSWSVEGASHLVINIDADNVVTITYPSYWSGQETVLFTMVDAMGYTASDAVAYTMTEQPVVEDIPDQSAPFTPFDLDDYLNEGDPALITWSASGMICMDVDIDPVTHVATVTIPDGCDSAETITFTASIISCSDVLYDQDSAVFDPGLSAVGDGVPVLHLGKATPNPYTSTTQISYAIPADKSGATAELGIYDVAGRRVRTLPARSPGGTLTTATWNGTDDNGRSVSAGIYFVQLTWNNQTKTTRVVLIR